MGSVTITQYRIAIGCYNGKVKADHYLRTQWFSTNEFWLFDNFPHVNPLFFVKKTWYNSIQGNTYLGKLCFQSFSSNGFAVYCVDIVW